MTQYPAKKDDAQFTEKQIMMRIYDSLQDILCNQARTEEKVDAMCKIIDHQQGQIDVLANVQTKTMQLEQKLESVSEMTEQKFKAVNENYKHLETRVGELEQHAAKTALEIWKKIGWIVISVVVTAVATGVVGHFMVAGGN